MACRTPVIVTRTGAAPELLNEAKGQIVEIDDVNGIADAIKRIIEMSEDEWSDNSLKAYQVACSHTWEHSSLLFEETLIKSVRL